MYYVYVLKSLKTDYFYKGMTDNLDRRIRQHLSGKCYSTKNKLPMVLIHVEVLETRKEARKMEKYLKSGCGREIIRKFLI